MTSAIVAENLSKKYLIGHKSPRKHLTFREEMTSGLRNLGSNLLSVVSGKGSGRGRDSIEEFWALRNVNFAIERGDKVGVIGRNGAGKSTLLKVLSRITEPSSGIVRLNGRVASLLEVGTGFHPELTGRENIFLNGAILGMSRNEIKKRFDEIVEFSGVDKFLDTPVKRYSSGMYVRLAFSVAAHMNPETLIVDEVLAVGDASFQRKCIGKMQEVNESGNTLLFVSHNMAVIEQLCARVLVLDSGKVSFYGKTGDAIKHYLQSLESDGDSIMDMENRRGSGEVRITRIYFTDQQGNVVTRIRCGSGVSVHIEFEKQCEKEIADLVVGVAFKNEMGSPVFLQHNRLTGQEFERIPGKGVFTCEIDSLPLVPSRYLLNVSIFGNSGLGSEYMDALENVSPLSIEPGDFFGTGELPGAGHGPVLVKANWQLDSNA